MDTQLCMSDKLMEWARGQQPERAEELAHEVAYAVHAFADEIEVGYANWLGNEYRVRIIEIQRIRTAHGTDDVLIKVQARRGEHPFYIGEGVEDMAWLSPWRIYNLGETELPQDDCDCNPLSGQVCGACRKVLRRIEAEREVRGE